MSRCALCSLPVGKKDKKVKLGGHHYHPRCFKCAKCKTSLLNTKFKNVRTDLVCQKCYYKHYDPKCVRCQHGTTRGPMMIMSNGSKIHKGCNK
ncbi:four and a half LIM domains protein 2-like [Convolutriloba macropyga]|uniref:four and a half LIM domains protein 2-like n=1 Tax=Convolutriloba macropyga TaxID=536237 RepID=UPI003F51BBB6